MLRAAVCDDEVVQAIGRGRGVNRTAETPLQVHILADLALPLVHDRVTSWDLEAPDLWQQMLLDGVAVDSPGDAAALHPGLLRNGQQAKMAFEREGFKAQTPMSTSYRDLCLKSARYRRSGRGRSWQRACWLDASEEAVREELEDRLGPMAGWQPEVRD